MVRDTGGIEYRGCDAQRYTGEAISALHADTAHVGDIFCQKRAVGKNIICRATETILAKRLTELSHTEIKTADDIDGSPSVKRLYRATVAEVDLQLVADNGGDFALDTDARVAHLKAAFTCLDRLLEASAQDSLDHWHIRERFRQRVRPRRCS